METITSRKNALVSAFRDAARARHAGNPVILLDGARLVEEALSSGIRVDVAAFSAACLGRDGSHAALAKRLEGSGTRVVEVPDVVMAAMSPVRTPSGIVALAERPAARLASALETTPRLVIVGIGIQDPGNVGAVVRVADAGGATAVIVCSRSADPFGWKALRGSMGSAFRIPIGTENEPAAAVARLRERGLRVMATVSRGGRLLYETDLTPPLAVMLGSEGAGLPDDLLHLADEAITVPMRPGVDSLNVAATAALIVYEAMRQRLSHEHHGDDTRSVRRR